MQVNDSVSNPRSAFRRDLTLDLQASISSGHEILLLGDFNEAFGSVVDGMKKVATRCGLLDLMSIRHSSQPPATYARGRTRLEYALAITHVANSLVKAGYEPFNAKFPSDHRAFFLDFDTKKLFGTDTQHLGRHANCTLHSNNVAQTTQYIQAKYNFLLQHNAFERGDQLMHPGNRHQFAERLDRDVVAASLAAENQLKKFAAPTWSVALDKARKKVTRLTKCLSMARTALDNTAQLSPEHHQAQWEEPFIIPQTVQECTEQIREAKRQVQEIVDSSFKQRDKERRERIQDQAASPFKTDKVHGQLLRCMQKAEDVKQLFRTADHRQGITRIEIPLHPDTDPKECQEWQQIDVPTEVAHVSITTTESTAFWPSQRIIIHCCTSCRPTWILR